MPTTEMILADGLCVTLDKRPILIGVELTAQAGATTVLLGPNGAGKTTFVRACSGLIPTVTGTLQICGRSPARAAAEGRIGLMPQATGAWSNIRAGALLRHLAALHINPVPIAPLAEQLGITDSLRTPYRQLSGGQQQAVNLIGALLGRPELLFLDEPTAGMDPRARRSTWDLVNELRAAGVAVLLTTHDMAEAEALADQIVILDAGRTCLRGTPASLTADGRSLEDVYLSATHDPGQVA